MEMPPYQEFVTLRQSCELSFDASAGSNPFGLSVLPTSIQIQISLQETAKQHLIFLKSHAGHFTYYRTSTSLLSEISLNYYINPEIN